nr:immunoglobulin light chain junction region [Macaca mulatta]MOX48138.1 immunoglobulin light chain junction region [Macaca mulatta]MOX48274.1 immunoglobulin light chain junction region [Macaca mulatta]MOX49005.1 immunoglobulin light chain junction region [Macaca mulatta]MOX49497.1 immunoglobulin light chain junction region [Macaca mulatta]
CLQYTSAPFTF